jgi:ADP-L-glycero-D-manno-heptose 6-epimerase
VTRTVLVTGSGGFIGRHIVAGCSRAGWAVTAVDCRDQHEHAGGVETILDDAVAPRLLDRVRDGVFAAVVHQAAITDTLADDERAVVRDNVRVPWRLAQACADSDTALIYASSSSVYGSIAAHRPVSEDDLYDPKVCSGPLNLYAWSKAALDTLMSRRTDNLRWVGLRYTNVFGSGEEHKGTMASILSQIARRAADGGRIQLFDDTLDACRDYLPVAALVDTVVRLLDHPVPSGAYNLGSGHAVSFAELLAWYSEFRGGDLDVQLVPNPVADRYQYWTCADMASLRSSLPGLTNLAATDIRAAAYGLYRSFAPTGPGTTPATPPADTSRTAVPST